MSVSNEGKVMKWQILVAFFATALSGFAAAQQNDQLEVRTVVQKEVVTVDENGNESARLVDAETVVPGEKVVYTITIRNVGEEPAENIVITNPIANELTYDEGSAFGAGMVIQFSVDGGATFAAEAYLSVMTDGAERPATPEDYTHVRWLMQDDLDVGAQGTARFAAVLN